MEGLITWAVIIIIIAVVNNSKKKAQTKNASQGQGAARPAAPRPNTQTGYTAPQANVSASSRRTVTDADRARLEEYRRSKGLPPRDNKSSILERAKSNATRYDADTTLETMEKEHGHSERQTPAIDPAEHKAEHQAHPHDAGHVSEFVGAEQEAILGKLEDLMVKGYDGNMHFERDFVAEGMDMINSFTLR